jgi:hypothetical protein
VIARPQAQKWRSATRATLRDMVHARRYQCARAVLAAGMDSIAIARVIVLHWSRKRLTRQ